MKILAASIASLLLISQTSSVDPSDFRFQIAG
jgi:hypothetical protein